MNYSKAHALLGHNNEEMTRKIANYLDWELTKAATNPCEPCTIAKYKQKNACKESKGQKATDPNGWVYLDISMIKVPAFRNFPAVKRPHWRIVVDEMSQKKHSHFFETKDGMVVPTCTLFTKQKADGRGVKFLQMDNAGENKKLQSTAEKPEWGLGITCNFTAAVTPLHNHLAEMAFTTIAARGRAMMCQANLPLDMRY